MLTGPDAVDAMVARYPRCHVFFGDFASGAHFAVWLSTPDWIVLHDAACWIMLQDLGRGTFDLHWFCPEGADMPVLRALLAHAFDHYGVRAVCGMHSDKDVHRQRARVVARALGAARSDDGVYVLTKTRFRAYNGGRLADAE